MKEATVTTINRTHMLIIEFVALFTIFYLVTQGWVHTIIDGAIVVIALSVVGYISLYMLNRISEQ